ncbi:uncharacterized protein LOC135163926 [Diachasmimorpha longicaudata]|uniref:uncharacterized protein LOC135163926 n=1 Tax=Diachasmimorpha longicaudata TaxID=58733 RepID=UPI0030B899BF
MRKLSMKGKRRRSENNSDGESEENGGAGSNTENSIDATEAETMPKTKRKASRGKNNGKTGDDRSITPQKEETENNEMKVEEENENGHGEKGVARKRRKKEEQKPTTSQDNTDENEEEKEYEVEKIVAHRTIKGRRQFLVRWKGYNDDADTWEQEKDLSCPQLIEDFLNEQDSKDEGESSNKSPKKVERKAKKPKKANNVKKENNSKEDNAEYEVERIIDVYFKKNGKREFLIRWKGFKPSEDTWEPEDNLNCPELIKKFMAKVEEAKSASPRSLRTNPIHTKRYTLTTTDSGRRLSRRNTGKQRATYHHCDE